MENETGIFRTKSILSWKGSGLYDFFRLIKLPNFITPNVDRYWEKTALKKIPDIFNQHKIELIYATYPSMSALRLGMRLSGQYNVPLITEFRDGLVYEPLFHFNPLSFVWATRFERRLIGASSAVITIGNELSRYFAGRYPLKKCFYGP